MIGFGEMKRAFVICAGLWSASVLGAPEVSWSVMHPTAIDTNYMARVAAKAVEYGGVDSFEVCGGCHGGSSGINGLSFLERYPHAAAKVDRAAVERNRREMNAICGIAHGIGKPLYYWHREIFIPEGLLEDLPQLLDADGEFDLLGKAYQDWLRYKLEETFRHCPDLDGIVLTLTEADYSVIHNSNPRRYPPQKVVEELVGHFAAEHERRGKRFILRSFGSNSQDYIDIIGGAKRAAARHAFEIETKVTEADFVPWLPKNRFLRKNPPLTLGAECDALGEYLSAGYLPAAQVGRIREYVASAREEGADRYTIRIDRVGNSIFDTAHEVNLYAYMRFIADPSATEDGVLADYAAKRFGAAAKEMVPLVRDELEMIRNIHYVASNLVFHTFPLKADFKTVKAGGIFSVYRENSSLEATKDIWSILHGMRTPSHAQVLAEKEKGLAMAEAGLAKVESLKDKLPADEYARQHRAFAAAVKAAKALQAFAKCCVAYFEDMAAKRDEPACLRRESDAAVELIESLMADPKDDFTGREAYFSVVGGNLDRVYFTGLRYYCRELLNEYACERKIRRRYEARPEVIDFVAVGGIYDDNRTIRTMHGAYTKTLPGRVVRQAGNPVFPNGTISVRFRDVPGAKVEVALDPSGAQEYSLDESVAEGVRTVTVGKRGRDYPALLAIALVSRPTAATIDLTNVSVTGLPAAHPAHRELVKHLELVSGAKPGADGAFRIHLGERAPGEGEPAKHTSYARLRGNDLYLWGDGAMTPRNEPYNGTLFAVYGFLEAALGIRWVRPGDEGIVFRPMKSVRLEDGWSWTYRLASENARIRAYRPEKGELRTEPRWDKYSPHALREGVEKARRRSEESVEWMLRMRHQLIERPSMGHAFENWNARFRDTHPEYLALNAKGERGCPSGSSKAKYVKLCISNEAVADQIVADWVKAGKPRYFNVCPNDGRGYCTCPGCRALDRARTPDEPYEGNMANRYVNLWNRLARKAIALRPDVILCTYAYSDYCRPPRDERIEHPDHMIFGMVPSQEEDNLGLIRAWRAVGMKRFVLRPNYLCYKGGFIPRGYERFIHGNFRLNREEGMVGCDFDATPRGGITDFEYYAAARVITDPGIPFETIEREFLSQYGAAADLMGTYYARIRARGEKGLAEARARNARAASGVSAKAMDDSQLFGTVFDASPREALEEDLAILRKAAAVSGLTPVERRRVEKRVAMGEHAIRTREFILARDRVPRAEFAKMALDLIDFRIRLNGIAPDNWGVAFRAWPMEVRWWRHVSSEIKAKYPEMEMDD